MNDHSREENKKPQLKRLCKTVPTCTQVEAASSRAGGAPEELAQRFHEAYERLAPDFGYSTREASRKPWAEVPEQNRKLMIAVCAELLHADAARPRSQSDPMAEVTASGLTRAEVHGIAAQLDREQQADCPHLRIGANQQGVLCRDCRKQWTGKEAERIWAELPSEGAEVECPRAASDFGTLLDELRCQVSQQRCRDLYPRVCEIDAESRASLGGEWRCATCAVYKAGSEARSSPVEAHGWQPKGEVHTCKVCGAECSC